MLFVHLFVSYAHVNLCHFFSSSWCRGLAAASACGSSWNFLFTFFQLSWLGPDDLSLVTGPPAFNSWTFVAPAFQSWFAVEYSSCFISVMNLDLYVRCFDSLMSRGPSRGPNNFYVYMNHSRT